jgi:hypothetical protein
MKVWSAKIGRDGMRAATATDWLYEDCGDLRAALTRPLTNDVAIKVVEKKAKMATQAAARARLGLIAPAL